MSEPTAALVVIGDEILSGRTADRNINALARFLSGLGIDFREVRVVSDDEAAIIAAINALRPTVTYLFTTGGIGPTHDDITAAAIARAFGVPLVLDQRAVDILAARYPSGGLTESRLRMAMIPEGAELIANPVTAAPGFRIGNVHVMAGVPAIMRGMLQSIAPTLVPGRVVLSETVPAAIGESVIAVRLGAIQADFPDVAIGSYPQMGERGFSTELVLRSRDAARLAAATALVRELVDTATRERKNPAPDKG
ncbi:MAG: competence/damage-inducible protein A [Bauldia sp.]|nr:competence/damage-inducible protein A [Bauldia sp.]